MQRLQFCFENNKLNYAKQGVLFGFNSVHQNNDCFCVGATDNEEDISFANVLLGAYFLGSPNEPEIIDFCLTLAKNKKSGKFLVLIYNVDKIVKLFDIKSKKLTDCNCEFVDYNDALTNIVQISLNSTFHVKFQFFKENFIENVEQAFENLKNSFGNGIFNLSDSSFKLTNETATDSTIEDLYCQIEEFADLEDVQIPANMKKKMIEKYQKNLKNKKQMLHFQHQGNFEKPKDFANTSIEMSDGNFVEFFIPIKIILNVQLENNLNYLYRVFSTALNRSTLELKKIFLQSLELPSLSMPELYNFYNSSQFTHVITAVFHQIDNEDAFLKQRENLHLKYLVPNDKPTFKRINSLHYKSENETRLYNVHLGLNSGIKNGQCAIVSGRYLYYHYNQDQTNDSGWGCAYRSLQTIISWFQLQGYIDIDKVPTHKQIQQALVDVGDKEPNFVGTSKWIGSQEVCYVLSHLFCIDSKIIFINSGGELANKARELIQHFNKNGTPIMIGGGVLAHTIIGVDFDEKTGDVKFLVLDPHYVGDEDIGTIHKKVCFFINFLTFTLIIFF